MSGWITLVLCHVWLIFLSVDNDVFHVYSSDSNIRDYNLPNSSNPAKILTAAWHNELLCLLNNHGTINLFRSTKKGFQCVKTQILHYSPSSNGAEMFTHAYIAVGHNKSYIATMFAGKTPIGGEIKVWTRKPEINSECPAKWLFFV